MLLDAHPVLLLEVQRDRGCQARSGRGLPDIGARSDAWAAIPVPETRGKRLTG